MVLPTSQARGQELRSRVSLEADAGKPVGGMHVKLERFEGPLDLLLQIILREELPISEISLAAVTEQYLAYLETHADLPPEELADFLVVAAKLLLLKSKILLPNFLVEDENDEQGLVKQLTIYRAYVEAGKRIAATWRRWRIAYARERLVVAGTSTFSPPSDLTSEILRGVLSKILSELTEFVRPMPELVSRTVSLAEKIATLRSLLMARERLSLSELLREARSRMDIIVTFLALLELIKQRHVVAEQTGHGDPIMLAHIEVAVGS